MSELSIYIIRKYDKYTVKQLKAKAQTVFNKWIRTRDEGRLCISCGSNRANQAGHYYSRGSHPALALNEVNTNLQCTYCNLHQHGNLILYREGLIKRYGDAPVIILDNLAKVYKRGWKPDRFYYIEAIEKYKNFETK